jgi:hypothetical protein
LIEAEDSVEAAASRKEHVNSPVRARTRIQLFFLATFIFRSLHETEFESFQSIDALWTKMVAQLEIDVPAFVVPHLYLSLWFRLLDHRNLDLRRPLWVTRSPSRLV